MRYHDQTDVVILTAMPEELEPVLAILGGRDEWKPFFIHRFEHYRSRFNDDRGNSLDIVACSLWKTGSDPTTAEVIRLKFLKPRLLVMTGICGGWEGKDNITVGDVLIAERAFHSEEGKLTTNGLQADIDTYNPPPFLLQWLKQFCKNTDWAMQIKAPRPKSLRHQMVWILCQLAKSASPHKWPTDTDWPEVKEECPQYSIAIKFLKKNGLITSNKRISKRGNKLLEEIREKSFGTCKPEPDRGHPQSLSGVFAQSSAVIADKTFFLKQEDRSRKIRAVEMEVKSFYSGALEIGANAFAVKGVSDYATPDKDDIFHQYAAEASARWMHAFIQKYMVQIAHFPRCGEGELQEATPEQRHFQMSETTFFQADRDYDEAGFIREMQQPPSPWLRTNHSEYRIGLRSVPPKWIKEIKTAISRYFNENVDEIEQIEEVAEDSGSANFKISCKNRPPILFRVNKRLRNAEAISTIAKLGNYFHRKNVLPDSPVRDALKPLEPAYSPPLGCKTIARLGDAEAYLSAYQYVENADHYAGFSLEELDSLAREFARLQTALVHLSQETGNIDLGVLAKFRPDLTYHAVNIPIEYQRLKRICQETARSYNRRDIPHGRVLNEIK
jgi:nucleoside phosphorylase